MADAFYSQTPAGSINIIVPFLTAKLRWGVASFPGSVGTLASFSEVGVEGISVGAEEDGVGFKVERPGWLLGDTVGSGLRGFMTLLAWTVIRASLEAIFGII
jgi:hypothetical protein